MKSFSIDEFLRQVMKGADDIAQKDALPGLGFVIGPVKGDKKIICQMITPATKVTTLPQLRRFAASLRRVTMSSNSVAAGVLCEVPLSLDGAAPEPTILLYVDQKYESMRVYLSKREGEHLLFRDMGSAHPKMNFLPNLIPIESYGPIKAEA